MPNNQKGSVVVILLLIIILLLLMVIGGGTYYLNKLNSQTPAPSPYIQTSVNQSEEPASISESNKMQEYTFIKDPNSSLKSFKVSYPQSWSLSILSDNGLPYEMNLSKNNYTIKIIQAATGGSVCMYEGEIPEGPVVDNRNNTFVEIKSDVGPFRRVETPPNSEGSVIFTFCGMSGSSYWVPTSIGAISYTVPANYDRTVLVEMDNILSGIKEVK